MKTQFEAARAAVEAFENGPYREGVDRIKAMTGEAPPSKVTVTDRSGGERVYSVYDADQLPEWRFYDPVRTAAKEHEAYLDRMRTAEVAIGWDAIEDRMRVLDSAEAEARQHLMGVPAPDAIALAYKLRLALEAEDLDGDRDVLASDAARIAA